MQPTNRELHWINHVEMLKREVNAMQSAKNPDKKEIWFMNSYIKYLDEIIKLNNLQLPDSENSEELAPGVFRGRRLVQICRRIPGCELDHDHFNWFIFNGLYVETEVLFVDASMYKKLYNQRSRIMNIPDSILDIIKSNAYLPSVHDVRMIEDGSSHNYYTFLCNTELLNSYCQYNSNWQYPYIEET